MKIAIIPARGGSKRIRNKNILNFLGKPIIAYAIEQAYSSELFDEIMISTDNEEIANIAIEYGAKVPFFRSKENSGDYATIAESIKEVLLQYKKKKINFQYCCVILPTAPLLEYKNIIKAYELLRLHPDAESVSPIVKFEYPIQRSLVIENNYVKMSNPESYSKMTQQYPSHYHDSGQFYFFRVDSFMKRDRLLSDKSLPIILSNLEVQDIDTKEDWKLAEIKYKYIKTNN